VHAGDLYKITISISLDLGPTACSAEVY